MDNIIKWWLSPAKWWQFWKPQSDIIGGIILGVIIFTPIILLLYVTKWTVCS